MTKNQKKFISTFIAEATAEAAKHPVAHLTPGMQIDPKHVAPHMMRMIGEGTANLAAPVLVRVAQQLGLQSNELPNWLAK